MQLKITQNFDEIYSDMLTQFPKNELKTYEQFMKLTQHEEYKIYGAIENGEKVGYISIVENKNLKYIWIDYLAVLRVNHGKGFGHKILSELKNIYKDFNGAYLEVEKIDKAFPNTVRRVNFYESQGARTLDVDYLYPDYNEDLPMNLYYFPYKEQNPNKTMEVIKFHFSILHSDLPTVWETYKKIKVNH